MVPVIAAQNIVRTFKPAAKSADGSFKPLAVLRGISLDVPAGKVCVIVGASGAGKSTLLHIIGGLDVPDSGAVIISGTNLMALGDKARAQFRNRKLGFVFQFHHLLPEFTAAENVALPLLIGKTSKKEAMRRAEELLTAVGLHDRLEHRPAALSGGEQQRVAMARALANDPEIILADEPSGNLDSENARVMIELILRLKKDLKKTFLIVTHQKELMSAADVVFEMRDGRIVNAPDTAVV